MRTEQPGDATQVQQVIAALQEHGPVQLQDISAITCLDESDVKVVMRELYRYGDIQNSMLGWELT